MFIVYGMFCISRSRAGCDAKTYTNYSSGGYEFLNLAHNTV